MFKYTAIVVDVDGTLAHMVDRSPYDPSLYHTDVIDEVVRDLANSYYLSGHKVVICSGRDDTYRDATLKWLKDNHVLCSELLMRKAGDKREDSIVKNELYIEHIKPNYNVLFVLDDRNRVVKMWRENGLKCFQVAEGDF